MSHAIGVSIRELNIDNKTILAAAPRAVTNTAAAYNTRLIACEQFSRLISSTRKESFTCASIVEKERGRREREQGGGARHVVK